MLSTEGPSGPSSSCQVSAVVREERSLGGEQVDPSGLNRKQSPQFSIRDYVFTARHKDIRKNWPFPRQHLKLCLKHGISVLLPPFEPPDSLRSRICTDREGSGRLPACADRDGSGIEPNNLLEKEPACLSDAEPKSLEHDSHLTSYPLALESAHQGDKQTSGKGNQNNAFEELCNDAGQLKSGDSNIESVVTSLAHIEQSNTKQSGKHCPLPSERILKTATKSEVRKQSFPENVKDSSGKRFKLIVKLGVNPELGRGDEVSSNSSMISDAMASKVCPVCKAFSSTSNTTLNAHIDQCLSEKSHTDQVIDVLSINKVKPPKKRLMVDIYKTASPCTLEDLDRRNGTTWALDLASLPVAGEVCVDNKRQKVASLEEDDGRKGKGAVFVDSDGTKVCILSMLNAMAPPTPAEPSSFKRPSPVKRVKQRLGLTIGRGRLLAPKPKHMKVRASTKKDNSLALLRNQIQEEPYNRPIPDVAEAQHPCERSSFQNQINRKVFGTFKRSFPSKESAVAKKLKGAVAHNADENPSSICSVKVDSCHSHSERSAALKCIELATPIDSASMARIKNTSMLSSSSASGDCIQKQSQSTVDNESSHWTAAEFPSEGNLNLKQPKDTKRLFWVRGRRKVKRTSRMNEKSADCLHPETDASEGAHHPTTQDRRTKLGTSKKKSLLPSSKLNNRQRKKLILKRLKKCKSTKRTCPTLKDLTPDFNGCLARSNYSAMAVNDVNDPKGSGRFKTNVTIQNHLPDQSTLVASELKLPVTLTGKDGNYRFQERFNLEGECCNCEATDIEMQTEHSVDPAGMSKSSFDRDPPIAGEYIASEGLFAASDSSLKSWARLVENDSFVPGREVWAEAHDPRLFDDQMILDNGTSNENTASGNVILGDGGFQDAVDACPKRYYMECQTNAQQVLGSSTCQSSSANTGAEVPQGNSSVTSIMISNGDHNVASDREPCGSPVSDTSNVSHPSAEERKEQASEVVIGEGHAADEIGGRSKLADAWEPGSPRKKRLTGGCDQEMIRNAMSWHHASFWPVNQPCCCSRREALGTESLLSMNHMIPQMTHPTNMRHAAPNQMTHPTNMRNAAPNLQLFGELVASPFRSCQRSRTETAACEAVQSSPDYVLQRAHLSGVESCRPSGLVGSSFETEQQAVPNPVLRLMGKDVMVVNKDEEHARHQNTAPFSSSFPASSIQHPSSFIARHQSMEGWKIAHSIPAHGAALSNSVPFMGMPTNGGLDSGDLFCTLQNRQARFDNTGKARHVPHQTREVIVIDDSEADPEPENALSSPASTLSSTVRVMDARQVQPPSYFYPQYSLPTRGLSGRWRPGFQNVCSTGIADSSEGRDHHNPSPSPHSRPAQFYFKS